MDIVNTAALASLAHAAPAASATSAATALAAPDALAASRFAEIMAQPLAVATPAAVNPVVATTHMVPIDSVKPLPANASVGDRILNGMQGVSNDFRNSWDSVNKVVNSTSGEAVTMQEMLKLQMQLTQVTFQYDMVGKAVSRSTQNIDQLVRVQ